MSRVMDAQKAEEEAQRQSEAEARQRREQDRRRRDALNVLRWSAEKGAMSMYALAMSRWRRNVANEKSRAEAVAQKMRLAMRCLKVRCLLELRACFLMD